MKGDYSRFTFDRGKRFSGVRLQQGRVALDADWNEQLDIATYLRRTVTADLLGPSGAPLDGGGFELAVDGDDISVSAGRFYVDGVLVESEAAASYLDQPHLPGTALPTEAGRYVAYLEAWQRHVTGLEDPGILEPALGGPDTATRQQTVWQLKVEKVDDDTSCADLEGFAPAGTTPRPALAARGLRAIQENRLYRVEIHKVERDAAGDLVEATFKWSRDNGTVAARIANPRLREIVITSRVDQDPSGGFVAGQWIEVTDTERVLRGDPGVFARLAAVSGDTLLVESWPGGEAPDLSVQPVVRRWDSIEDVTVEIPLTNDGWLPLEDGIEIQFGADTLGALLDGFVPGDYWLVPARVEAGVLWPVSDAGEIAFVAPHGVERLVAPLATFSFTPATGSVPAGWELDESCRQSFRPAVDFAEGKVSRSGDVITGPLTIDESEFQVVVGDKARLRVLSNGRVGIGTEEPTAALEIDGAVKLTASSERAQTLFYHRTTESGSPVTAHDDGFRVRYDLDFLGTFQDALVIDKTDFNHAEPDGGIVFANTGRGGQTRAALTIRGSGNVGIGTTTPRAKLEVRGGPIMPAEGNSEEAGILFPRDPFGGSGDRAWIRYYARDGENTTFEIGTANDRADHIALMPSAGNVGVGTNNPQARLQVVGGAIMPSAGNSEEAGILFPRDPFGGGGDRAWIRYYSRGGENTTFAMGTSNDYTDHIALLPQRGNVGVKRDDPQFPLDVNGVIRGGFFFGFSDERLKTDIESVAGALDLVRKLRGVRFAWRPDASERFGLRGTREIGLIGQEVEKVVPEVVVTDGEGMKSVEYSHLVAILIEAIKELEERYRGLAGRLAEAT